MTIHAPSILKGPITRERPWWLHPARPNRRRRGRTPAGIRADLVARVRQQIADGTYDTPERWEAALEKLSQSLNVR